jgi:pyruvate formate lyase activating enzyme
VCPAGTNAGYPEFSNSKGPEYGWKNLAVFYHGCNFNCLYCQNWHYKEQLGQQRHISAKQLSDAIDQATSCICYFGGDPTPQLPHALQASKMALERKNQRVLRICWETNGAMSPSLLIPMISLSMKSGGSIKFDLKCFDNKLHMALCGVSNQQTLKNFAHVAIRAKERRTPPLLIASTLLVPGYIDSDEIFQLARFIAELDPNIPYSLLGFSPQFYFKDLPVTSLNHVESCKQAALDAGLENVRIGNKHLLGKSY